MSSTESVSEWLAGLKRGDPQAAEPLWERYVARLSRLAARKLGTSPCRAADEEDVVAVAFASFCRAADVGRFAKLDDRDDLWQVLVMLTERKAFDQRRREYAEKRGGGQVRGESGFDVPDASDSPVQYELASTPPSWLIVWLDSDGDSLHPWVRPTEAGRRIVTTKPGDVILHRGEPKTVARVAVCRALGVEPGTEVVE